MSQDRTIVIVGGVAGGASAAARARRVNEEAEILLLERGEEVSFANCGLPYYIGGVIENREDLLVASPELIRKRFQIDVRTRHEVTDLDRDRNVIQVKNLRSGKTYEQPYDRLILSPGADPVLPPIEGVDANNVFTLRDLQDTDRIKQHLDEEDVNDGVVVGAGFIGLEMVEMFHRRGLDVHLVEMEDQVLPPLDPEMAALVEQELQDQGVNVFLDNACQSLATENGSVKSVVLQDGQTLPADVVLMAVGVQPNRSLAEQAGLETGPHGGIQVDRFLRTSDPDIYAVGDVVEYEHGILNQFARVPLAGPANRSGRLAGEHAATDQSDEMRPVLGTAIVKVFDQTVAITGLNRDQADELERPVEAVWIPSTDHAGYYPGAKELTLKVLYDQQSGELIGAQCVGYGGVDKRIDVMATLMSMNGTTKDLSGVDLAYAPPYGHAKDPLHMAGFAAENARSGQVEFRAPDPSAWPEEALILDVRTSGEFESGHLDDAEHVPLHELREHLDELNDDRPMITVCKAGKRAYYAARILNEHGLKNVSIAGGGMDLLKPAVETL